MPQLAHLPTSERIHLFSCCSENSMIRSASNFSDSLINLRQFDQLKGHSSSALKQFSVLHDIFLTYCVVTFDLLFIFTLFALLVDNIEGVIDNFDFLQP